VVGGKPAEPLCTACHTTFQPNLPGATLEILDVPVRYIPDQVYTISVRLTSTFALPRRWGFEMTALTAATGDSAGSFLPAPGTTQVVSGSGSYAGRKYIEHTSAGTFPNTNGPQTWTFEWKAPGSNVGQVLFFAAGNAANNNNANSGVHIYTTSDTSEYETALAAPGTRVASLELSAGPNPARGRMSVLYALPRAGAVSVAVHDLQGRRVRTLFAGAREAGRYAITWDGTLEDGRRAGDGVYFVRLFSPASGAVTRKVTLVQ
jgi:hypothetical protein